MGMAVIDTFYFLNRTARSEWDFLSLHHIASKLGLQDKLPPPPMDGPILSDDHLRDILRYNLRDVYLHADVAVLLGIPEMICMQAGTSRSSLEDSTADNTGVMVFNLLSSHAPSKGMVIDGAKPSPRGSFNGGKVVDPDIGLHQRVVITDAVSLYPEIMKDLGLVIDNCHVLGPLPDERIFPEINEILASAIERDQ